MPSVVVGRAFLAIKIIARARLSISLRQITRIYLVTRAIRLAKLLTLRYCLRLELKLNTQE